jgi:hypothetical protein
VEKVVNLLKSFLSEYKVVFLTLAVIVLSSGLLFQYCETQRLKTDVENKVQQFEKDKKILNEGYTQVILDIKRIEKEYTDKIEKVKLQFAVDYEALEDSMKKNMSDLSKDFVKMGELLKMLGFDDVTTR